MAVAVLVLMVGMVSQEQLIQVEAEEVEELILLTQIQMEEPAVQVSLL